MGMTLMGSMKGVHHCLWAVAKVGGSDINDDDMVESPTKNTRKRKSNIPAVDSPTMATREKGGHK